MRTITYKRHYQDLLEEVERHFKRDDLFVATFLTHAIMACEDETARQAISARRYGQILDNIGPAFNYTDKDEKTRVMVLARLPMLPFTGKSECYRLYVVSYSDLLFHKSLLVDMPIITTHAKLVDGVSSDTI